MSIADAVTTESAPKVFDWAPFTTHPLADLFPMMTDAEIGELADDIRKNGQRQKIVLHRDEAGQLSILDGRNRFQACKRADVPMEVEVYGGESTTSALLAFVLSANLHRRQLSTSQRAMVVASAVRTVEAEAAVAEAAAEAAAEEKAAAARAAGATGVRVPAEQVVAKFISAIEGKSTRQAMVESGVDDVTVLRLRKNPDRGVRMPTLRRMFDYLQSTGVVGANDTLRPLPKATKGAGRKQAQTAAAVAFGVSPRSVEHAGRVLDEGVPELQAAVQQNTVSVFAASAVATLPAAEQAGVLAQGPAAVVERGKSIRQLTAEARRETARSPYGRLASYLEKVVALHPPPTFTDDDLREACTDPDFAGSDLARYTGKVSDFLIRVLAATPAVRGSGVA